YATLGEFIAWIIGWDLVLEYAVAAATVASSWSGYLQQFLQSMGLSLPRELIMSPFDRVTLSNGEVLHGLINLPAVFIVVVISLLLLRGTQQSSWVNNVFVVLKIAIVLAFILIGWHYIRPSNLQPF